VLLARWDFTESVGIVAGHAGVGELFLGICALECIPLSKDLGNAGELAPSGSLLKAYPPTLVALGRLSMSWMYYV
jgi:hypothetical protein